MKVINYYNNAGFDTAHDCYLLVNGIF